MTFEANSGEAGRAEAISGVGSRLALTSAGFDSKTYSRTTDWRARLSGTRGERVSS